MNTNRQSSPPDPLRQVRILKRLTQLAVYPALGGYTVAFRLLLDMSIPQLMGTLVSGIIIATYAIEGAFWQMFKLRKQSAYPHLIALELGTVQELRQACDLAVRLTSRWLRARAAVLGWVQDFEKLLPVASYGMPDNWYHCAPPLAVDLPLLSAVQSGQTVISPAGETSTWSRLFDKRHRVAYVPLIAMDRVTAVLCLVDSGANADLRDRKLLQSIGIVIGLSLENMRLHDRQYESIMHVLCSALDMRDSATQGHSQRVARLASLIAQQLSLPGTEIKQIEQAAALHDIGKIGVSDAILSNPGPLSEDDWAEMRRHPSLGFHILSDVEGMKDVAEIVFSHHERYDAKGYPRGLGREAIPLGARIFAVVDSYDAMTSHRPYRQARPHREAIDEIVRNCGSQFDPMVVRAFLEVERMGLIRTHSRCGGQSIPPEVTQAIASVPSD